MGYTLPTTLMALTIGAFVGVTAAAAAGNSGDAAAMREQAVTHPNEMNQAPEDAPGLVALGEVYPQWAVSGGHFNRSRSEYTALAPYASSCHMYKLTYGGFWETECGPQ